MVDQGRQSNSMINANQAPTLLLPSNNPSRLSIALLLVVLLMTGLQDLLVPISSIPTL